MKYVVYEVRNKVNGMIYVGCHATENPNDNYLGGSDRIKKALNRFGRPNFTKRILHIADSDIEARRKEREIVNQEFIARKDTYNIKLGGVGRTGKLSEETKQKMRRAKTGAKNPFWRRKHSAEARARMSASHKMTRCREAA